MLMEKNNATHTLTESVLETTGNVLQVTATPSTGRATALSLLTPVVCYEKETSNERAMQRTERRTLQYRCNNESAD